MNKNLFLTRYYLSNLINVKLVSRLQWFLNKSEFIEMWGAVADDNKNEDIKDFLVVGNGPSLEKADLEALSYMPSIASNKIDLLFESTTWRPTYVTICDPLLAYKLRNYKFDGVEQLFCSDRIYPLLRGAKCKLLPWKNMPFQEAYDIYTHKGKFDVDPRSGFFEGYSVTVQNIQFAIWLGAKRIFIVGCDHFYDEQKIEKHGAKVSHEGCNHFHKDYRKPGELVNNAPVMLMNLGYEIVKEAAKQSGVEIINISKNSYLDTFLRDTVENVVANKRSNV